MNEFLGQVPLACSSGEECDHFAALVLNLVDGMATVAEVLEKSPLGRQLTGLVLTELREQRRIVLTTRASADAPVPLMIVSLAQVPLSPYEALFRRAAERYLARDDGEAFELLSRCAAQRPEDRRVLTKLARLEARRSAR